MGGVMESAVSPQLLASNQEILSILLYSVATITIVAAMLLAAGWFGHRRPGTIKKSPYESGILPSPRGRYSYPAPFYLVAIFFIIFDVETIFIYAWAVVWEDLGLPGLIQITVFIAILFLGLVWLWLKGGLDWGPAAARPPFTPDNE